MALFSRVFPVEAAVGVGECMHESTMQRGRGERERRGHGPLVR